MDIVDYNTLNLRFEALLEAKRYQDAIERYDKITIPLGFFLTRMERMVIDNTKYLVSKYRDSLENRQP